MKNSSYEIMLSAKKTLKLASLKIKIKSKIKKFNINRIVQISKKFTRRQSVDKDYEEFPCADFFSKLRQILKKNRPLKMTIQMRYQGQVRICCVKIPKKT